MQLAPAAHSCRACFVAGEPGGGGHLVVSLADAPPGGGVEASRSGGGLSRVYGRRAAVGLRCPDDSQNVAVGTIAHQFDEQITPSQQNNSDGHK